MSDLKGPSWNPQRAGPLSLGLEGGVCVWDLGRGRSEKI